MSRYNEPKTQWKYLCSPEKKTQGINDEEEFVRNVSSMKDYVLTKGMDCLMEKERYLNDAITKSQMRNLFDEVKKSEESDKTRLQIRLIYTAGKIDNQKAREFIKLLTKIMEQDFAFGKDFMESALAYHKFYARK